jgi:hypothetical protein
VRVQYNHENRVQTSMAFMFWEGIGAGQHCAKYFSPCCDVLPVTLVRHHEPRSSTHNLCAFCMLLRCAGQDLLGLWQGGVPRQLNSSVAVSHMWAPMQQQQQQQQWPHQCCMMRQLQQCRQQHAAAAACGGSNNSILRQLGQQQWRQLGLQLAQQAALQEQPAAAAHFSHQLQNGMPIWSGLVCCRLPTKAAAAALQILPTATAGVWDA